MRIVAVLETTLKAGGAHNQSLNALFQMKRICEGQFDLQVIAFDKQTVEVLIDKGFDGVLVQFSLLDKIKVRILNSFFGKYILSAKTLFTFEKKLISCQTDLVYFTGPSLWATHLKKTNYIFTLFDLAHRDFPEFPEVSALGEFQKRDALYFSTISNSYITLTDSKELSNNAGKFYGVNPGRLLHMPYGPSPDLERNSTTVTEVIQFYKLPEVYFFYPAQFWPHKNHIRVLEALSVLNNQGKHYHVVFSGGDKGNIQHILNCAVELSVDSQVHTLGLVPSEHIKGLYQGSCALVMPTYFGPTNLPPLESWSLGVPVIYSSHLAGEAGGAALLIDPDNAESLAEAMETVLDPDVRKDLVSRGYLRLKAVEDERVKCEHELLERLIKFKNRRKCWA
ncbi:glycosyltransferase family 4 protein [Daejeonella lutea]|uniref:Glycosyltransferase involved in cell wall bisynthesis n=1 Tax=Daejeonella lutea TaxID=572036 RepID=A0A1T5FBN5_9SPHI|nr:glycosyltransferase family 1 protein [Daejeonella lutea]SKB93579.1 Glycosyltransferase involved in cell wall bisynthesis [Daejeonella lutea]